MSHHKKLTKEDIMNKQNLAGIINDGRFRVAIFGSARTKPGEQAYADVVELAKNLTERGYDIVTGGGSGAMEAASYGHSLVVKDGNNSQAIGINIELPFEQHPNQYLNYTQTESTFSARLDTFMLLSHVFIVTPGGIGTLLELFYTWQLMQVHHICRSPIILWGKQYGELLDFMKNGIVGNGFALPTDLELAIHAEDMNNVIQLTDMAKKAYDDGGVDACVNIKQYLAGAKRLGLI